MDRVWTASKTAVRAAPRTLVGIHVVLRFVGDALKVVPDAHCMIKYKYKYKYKIYL